MPKLAEQAVARHGHHKAVKLQDYMGEQRRSEDLRSAPDTHWRHGRPTDRKGDLLDVTFRKPLSRLVRCGLVVVG